MHNEWRKKASVSCFQANTMFIVFSDIQGIMPHKYLPVGQTVNYYSYKDVLEGLRGKRTVAKDKSYGSTNGICHSALSVNQFLTPKKSPALFAKSRLLWIFMFTKQYFHKEAHFNNVEHIKQGTTGNLKSNSEEGFEGFEAWKKGMEKCVTASRV